MGSASVTVDYFDILRTPILSGRAFHSGDLAADARVVIVNQSFVDRVLGGRNPIGRRVSPQGEAPGPWYRIVGVVEDLGVVDGDVEEDSGLYHPVAPRRGTARPAA